MILIKIILFRFDGNHVVFGKVIEGINILNAIEDLGSVDGEPRANIKITDCGLIESPEIIFKNPHEHEDHGEGHGDQASHGHKAQH